jgi:hypothetical protein
VSAYGESIKPIEIDESEEIERMTLLKQRETLIRGMGKSNKRFFHSRKKIFFSMSKVLWICVIGCYSEHRVPWQMYQ